MNSRAKKLLSLLLSMSLVLGLFSVCYTAFGAVTIDESRFPDPVFRQIMINKFGTEIDDAEISKTTVLPLSGMVEEGQQIKNLKGIEVFASSLKNLRCGGIGLEELDVSALTNLERLTCQGNKLTTLNVYANTKLVELNCSDNESLISLTIGNLYNLQSLDCYACSLTRLNVSSLSNLIELRCDQNELTSIDVSKNTLLEEFTCSYNHIASLDLSNNTALGAVIAPSISDQTVTVNAGIKSEQIEIRVPVGNADWITSSSLDDEGVIPYTNSCFYANDVNDFTNGVDYTYSVGLPDSQDMEVHIDVVRDFYQVRYYSDSSKSRLLKRSFVSANTDASKPIVAPPEPCMVVDRWSADLTNVTGDIDAYATWRTEHKYALSDFADGVATITCPGCNDSYTRRFIDCVNKKSTDSGYCEYLDVVKDNIINAKDYAKITKMF